jgi:hypothetical protein
MDQAAWNAKVEAGWRAVVRAGIEKRQISQSYVEKVEAFDDASREYEGALALYREMRVAAADGEATLDAVEEAKEEVMAARAEFDAAELALNS